MAGFLRFGRVSPEGWKVRLCAVGVAACTVWPASPIYSQNTPAKDPWQAALAARQSFEAEPVQEHTRDEFAAVMDNFRAIYHGNPADSHAARAVDQVAQLLAEQGRELNDPKSLRAAAGQYEFLAKAYPASSLAAPGLGHALELLGPDAANDPDEAAKVRAAMEGRSPKSAASVAAGRSASGVEAGSASEERRSPAGVTTRKAEPAAPPNPVNSAGLAAMTQGQADRSAERTAAARADDGGATGNSRFPPGMTERKAGDEARSTAPAVVTGIRHWSTASYTRVAIDLGGEVQFQAARVEHPDRIFFDLHGAKLAAGLAGKSFAVTDDGFLKTIRAGQFGPDVTRVVLDVQPVAEYSAFLLPNPYRLIIDIHGRQPAEGKASVATPNAVPAPLGAPNEAKSPSQPAAPRDSGPVGGNEAGAAAPIMRGAPPATGGAASATEISTLPPMPVTDGSSSFGLPPKRDQPVTSAAVARPRVVVSAKPTVAKPVPNTVTSAAPESSRDIAAVSDQPGVVSATEKPTDKPVVDRGSKIQVPAARVQGTASREQGSGIRTQGSGHRAQPANGGTEAAEIAGAPAAPAPPTADGQSTLMRALGLKIGRIVIDAGHGGHDSGTLGPEGIEEKDVVLDVALRLGKLLHDRLGAEVVYTRADDTFIPLETRTAIANKAQADLFISVHANSSQDPDARGVEVYYLNFTSDPEAMQVASRENAVSSARVNQLSDLVKKIALKDKIDESRELAADVDQSLYSGLKKGNAGLKDRGVKKAPFVVLIGANMPSILAEISFVTNPEDAAELNTPEYRERVAESLYGGIARYAGAINGAVRPARAKVKATERAER